MLRYAFYDDIRPHFFLAADGNMGGHGCGRCGCGHGYGASGSVRSPLKKIERFSSLGRRLNFWNFWAFRNVFGRFGEFL